MNEDANQLTEDDASRNETLEADCLDSRAAAVMCHDQDTLSESETTTPTSSHGSGGMNRNDSAIPSSTQRALVRAVEPDLEANKSATNNKKISTDPTDSSRAGRLKFLRGLHKNRRPTIVQNIQGHEATTYNRASPTKRGLRRNKNRAPSGSFTSDTTSSLRCGLVIPFQSGVVALGGLHKNHLPATSRHVDLLHIRELDESSAAEPEIPTLQRHVRQRVQPSPGAVAIPPPSFEMNSASGSPSNTSHVGDITTADLIDQHTIAELAEAQPVEEDESMQVAVATTLEGQTKNSPAARLIPVVVLGIFLFSGVVGGFICAGGICRSRGVSPSIVARMETAAPTTYFRGKVEVEDIKLELMSLLGDDYFEPFEDEDASHVIGSRKQALNWILHEDRMQLNSSVSANLLQRYILVLFYFQTVQQSQWRFCNPLEGRASNLCYRPYAVAANAEKYRVWGSSWLSADHECQWAGILCEKSRNVTELELPNNNLNGPLPWELSSLNKLAVLDLSKNNLTGTIPQKLGLLSSLYRLELANNKLNGPIPKELFSGGHNGNNSPTTSALGVHPLLTFKKIELYGNSLGGTIPSEIGRSQWEWVGLGGNLLSGELPVELFQNSHLTDLFLSGNRKIGGEIPKQICLLTKLEALYLADTSLFGAIPSEMALLSNLQTLNLANTKLGGTIPEDLYGGMSKLVALSVSDCGFSGTISTSVGNWSHLTTLYAANNNFSGLIPEQLGSLTNLKRVRLNGNNFSAGAIPKSLCEIKKPVYAFSGWELVADCTPEATTAIPLVSCPKQCCTMCCDAQTKICRAN